MAAISYTLTGGKTGHEARLRDCNAHGSLPERRLAGVYVAAAVGCHGVAV